MRILILGGTGMLGHQVWAQARESHEVVATVRRSSVSLPAAMGFSQSEALQVDRIEDHAVLCDTLAEVRPEVVVNCVGVVKQRGAEASTEEFILLNALFPHRLSRAAEKAGVRVIHVSTDCVFSGQRGHYTESDRPDPVDVYGMTKLLGEVSAAHVLVIRTSMIGPELRRRTGLLEWALSQRGRKVEGYRNARFSGLSTPELARVILRIASEYRDLSGLFHVAGPAIDKYSLLSIVNAEYRLGLEIVATDEPVCDRTLCGDRFRARTGYVPPDWPTMVKELRSLRNASKGESRGD